jgi:hypothetical protein
MQGQLSGFSELGGDDPQPSSSEIDIVAIEADQFSRAHACHRKQPNGRLDGHGPQEWTQKTAVGHQCGDLLRPVNVRRDPPTALGKETSWGDLVARIDGVKVGGESPDHGEALEVA